MRPTATITVLPPASPDPTRKRVRITVSPAGSYLVRGWFTHSALPSDATHATGPESPGDAFYKVTDELGVCDVEVSNAQAAYFYCDATVMGLVASSVDSLPLEKVFLAAADGPIGDAAQFAAWVAALDPASVSRNPSEGDTFTLAVAPPPDITNLVIAYPDTIRVLYSAVQDSIGVQNRLSWINDSNSTTLAFEGRTYRVYQNVTLFPWTQPDTFTVTL